MYTYPICHQKVCTAFLRLPPPCHFFRGTNQELVINTELCDLAMTKEEGLIQVGKSRTENNQPSRIDRYTTNVYNQPGIQINIFW